MSYRKLIDSEQARRDLFTRGVAPGFFGEPSEHLRLRLEAVNRLRENAPAEAAELLARAAEATPPVRGQLNGQPFQDLRDADDLFGGVLEVMAQGRYFWAGLEQVRLVAMNPPRFPRDLLYIPAHLELATEAGEVFLPALYPGSHEHADDQVKLGRMTDWKAPRRGPDPGRGPAHLPAGRRRDQPAGMAGIPGRRSDAFPFGTSSAEPTARSRIFMARPDSQHSLQASLLDRIIDPDSDGTASRPGCTVEQMIDSVRRDLEDLLNTHRTVVGHPAPSSPRSTTRSSRIGLPDLSSYQSTKVDVRGRVAERIEQAIARFEPRLRNVRATADRGA